MQIDPNTKKNALYSLFLVLVLVGIWWYRGIREKEDATYKVEILGETMGTTYNIKYLQEQNINYKQEIDSLLVSLNKSLSTYLPESEISRFNKGTILKFESGFFYPVLKRSFEIYQKTNGAFNPTLGPLIDAWGFGPDSTRMPSKTTVDSLLTLVNFDSIYFDTISVCKLKKGIELSFSAIAKGYGVDVVAAFLKDKGINNMMVEIGGEVYCHGRNENGKMWKIGIDNPNREVEGEALQAVVELDNRALATSGNHRNYYEIDGKKYSHTINPRTGYPVRHSLLSASIFAKDCMTADAYATACMVMGIDSAIAMLSEDKSMDGYFVYSDEDGNIKTYTTEGIKNFISE